MVKYDDFQPWYVQQTYFFFQMHTLFQPYSSGICTYLYVLVET